MSEYSTTTTGEANTLAWRMFYQNADGKKISPFHDIPLVANEEKGTYNMVCEIPKGTNAKMEITLDEEFNPIKQDTKNGNLRFVADIMGKTGYPWNYGAFPQTWENSDHVDPDTKAKGDNDPLDVCDIGEAVAERGQIVEVKVVGVMALIDEGETDWKVLVINVNDPLADQINDVEDVEKHKPGYLTMVHDWFRDYKIPAGKPPNVFAFDGKALGKDKAIAVVKENHEFWKKLIAGEAGQGKGIAVTRANM